MKVIEYSLNDCARGVNGDSDMQIGHLSTIFKIDSETALQVESIASQGRKDNGQGIKSRIPQLKNTTIPEIYTLVEIIKMQE